MITMYVYIIQYYAPDLRERPRAVPGAQIRAKTGKVRQNTEAKE